MTFSSTLFSGQRSLVPVEQGRLALIRHSSRNDPEAVALIQQALVQLGYPMPRSTLPTGQMDGIYGQEMQKTVNDFQHKAFPAEPGEWDSKVGPKTLAAIDAALMKTGAKPVSPTPTETLAGQHICGPDVTNQIASTWHRIQSFFNAQTNDNKFRLCTGVLLPIKALDEEVDGTMRPKFDPHGDVQKADGYLEKAERLAKYPIEHLKQWANNNADVNSWETMPLYFNASEWLRSPPIHHDNTKGPLAVPTPSLSEYSIENWEEVGGYEDPSKCGHTVQVAGRCWLNGSVNYGTFGIMVRLCRDFANQDMGLKQTVVARTFFTLPWAETLIRAYKKFGPAPEPSEVPLAWTRATYHGGPRGIPAMKGNRSHCTCEEGPSANCAKWDFVWEPLKKRPP